MKKVLMSISAIALMFAATSCEPENQQGGVDFDEITLDGFYVYGAATGSTDITADYGMAAGLNEVSQSKRGGMYEKYIVLEGGKEFFLVLNEAGQKTNYGAALQEYNVTELADNPGIATVKRGELVIGENAPAMKVDKTGLYHIVLDLNLEGDLLYPQIIVSDVQWGVRGDMNSWGFTAFEAVEVNAQTMTWTMKDVEMPAGGKFKFAYGHGWKIQLDDAGNVKANTNLGVDCVSGGADIVLEKGGLYDITLTYTLKGGDIAASYAFTTKCTQESQLPTELYMIGSEFGAWNWEDAGVVTMVPVNGASGSFWATRYFTANQGFKFNAQKNWNGSFSGRTTSSGVSFDGDGNCIVETDGFYTIYVDLANDVLAVEPAAVYGMGNCFGNWEVLKEENKFVAEGTTLVSPETIAEDELRMYVAAPTAITTFNANDWWRMEFMIFDGVIEYRGAGGDQARVKVAAGQKVTLDFNAGTGSIN
ncbi:MAG: SusF/SusE family outer membrane protein [Bacteroidaceae bacterium]|nr:SusF/SusE family outer membrane protein [Bacteroidaceae bacterium]